MKVTCPRCDGRKTIKKEIIPDAVADFPCPECKERGTIELPRIVKGTLYIG